MLIHQDVIDSYTAGLMGIRHDIHRHPELGLEEVRTSGSWPTPCGPGGTFATRPGPMLSAVDQWTVIFRGTGDHGGSAPHLATDTTIALAHFILGVQTIIGRNVPALETAVLSVGHIMAGQAGGGTIIPSAIVVEAQPAAICRRSATCLSAVWESLPGPLPRPKAARRSSSTSGTTRR